MFPGGGGRNCPVLRTTAVDKSTQHRGEQKSSEGNAGLRRLQSSTFSTYFSVTQVFPNQDRDKIIPELHW